MPEGVLDRPEIVACLDELATLLTAHRAPPTTLIVVGGSYLTLHGLRDATADVDSVTRIDPLVLDATQVVAARRDLDPRWLNDHALAFAPQGLTLEMCDPLYERGNLRVLGPPPDYVFLMKLFAARAPDHDDMVALWPLCSFATPDEAAARFADAYPHAPDDHYLVRYVAGIADAATRR